jgi:hypothetical protein
VNAARAIIQVFVDPGRTFSAYRYSKIKKLLDCFLIENMQELLQ